MVGTVLLVEDDPEIAALVKAYVEQEGLKVLVAGSVAQGLHCFERHEIALAVVDRRLPDGDGVDLVRLLRSRSRLPIVMLTARDEEQDRVEGLDAGADDYVAKPFSPRELTARLRAQLRRADPQSERLVHGDLVLDRAGRVVLVEDSLVELTSKEFDLLAYLLENQGRVLTRDRLLDRVWGLEFPGGTRTVDVHVGQLRKKIGRPELVTTVRGVGYKVI